jgi:hypothetical protein
VSGCNGSASISTSTAYTPGVVKYLSGVLKVSCFISQRATAIVTSLKKKLIKIGAKVSHGRYVRLPDG